MKLKNKIVGGLLKMKNRQIRDERERVRALSETNSILSAYVASLIEDHGGARISREKIKNSIGKYTAQVISEGADYVISVISQGSGCGDERVCAHSTYADNVDAASDNCLVTENENEENADVRG